MGGKRDWTEAEDGALIREVGRNLPIEEIAVLHGRTVTQVASRCALLSITARHPIRPHLTQTRTGIIVGGAHMGPLPLPTADEEEIQSRILDDAPMAEHVETWVRRQVFRLADWILTFRKP